MSVWLELLLRKKSKKAKPGEFVMSYLNLSRSSSFKAMPRIMRLTSGRAGENKVNSEFDYNEARLSVSQKIVSVIGWRLALINVDFMLCYFCKFETV